MTRLSLGRLALVAAVAAPAAPARAEPGAAPQTQKINELIAEGWKKAEIKRPAARAGDDEFVRRAFIDLIGRIARPEEVLDFEADASPNKRMKLVHRLMNDPKYSPKVGGRAVTETITDEEGGKPKTRTLTLDYTEEYAEHWANLWTVWTMTRTGHPVYRERMRTWLEIEFGADTNHRDMVTKILTATGKSQGNGAVNFIIHHLGEAVPKDEQEKFGKFDAVPITSRVTKLFLGLQTQCTQCHDHPFNKEWVQADFWGVNAFFRQTTRDQNLPVAQNNGMMANPPNITLSDDSSQNGMGLVLYERRDGRRMASKPIFLKDLAQAEKGETSDKLMSASEGSAKSRRAALADFVVKHDNFARAYVNRVWGHLFGRGLNKDAPVDDFGSHNEVVHPELLNYLAEEFVKYNYNQKMLIEWIATSDAYSLSHVASPGTTDAKFDPYFARMPLKALSPEVLYESLSLATRAEDRKKTKKERDEARDAWTRKLTVNFGDDEGNELNFNGTVVQALLMMNGKELNDEIGSGKGRRNQKGAAGDELVIERVLAKVGRSPQMVYDQLFLMALNRHPTGAEVAKLEQVRSGGAVVKLGAGTPVAPAPPKKGGGKAVPPPKPAGGGAAVAPGAAANDVGFYQDVFWALLNSSEFMLNH